MGCFKHGLRTKFKKPLAAQSFTFRSTLGGATGRMQKPAVPHCSPCSPASRNSNIYCLPGLQAFGLGCVVYPWLPPVQCSNWRRTWEPKRTAGMNQVSLVIQLDTQGMWPTSSVNLKVCDSHEVFHKDICRWRKKSQQLLSGRAILHPPTIFSIFPLCVFSPGKKMYF